METTVDEDALPGKLPETPLRAEPPSSYKVNQVFGIIFVLQTFVEENSIPDEVETMRIASVKHRY